MHTRLRGGAGAPRERGAAGAAGMATCDPLVAFARAVAVARALGAHKGCESCQAGRAAGALGASTLKTHDFPNLATIHGDESSGNTSRPARLPAAASHRQPVPRRAELGVLRRAAARKALGCERLRVLRRRRREPRARFAGRGRGLDAVVGDLDSALPTSWRPTRRMDAPSTASRTRTRTTSRRPSRTSVDDGTPQACSDGVVRAAGAFGDRFDHELAAVDALYRFERSAKGALRLARRRTAAMLLGAGRATRSARRDVEGPHWPDTGRRRGTTRHDDRIDVEPIRPSALAVGVVLEPAATHDASIDDGDPSCGPSRLGCPSCVSFLGGGSPPLSKAAQAGLVGALDARDLLAVLEDEERRQRGHLRAARVGHSSTSTRRARWGQPSASWSKTGAMLAGAAPGRAEVHHTHSLLLLAEQLQSLSDVGAARARASSNIEASALLREVSRRPWRRESGPPTPRRGGLASVSSACCVNERWSWLSDELSAGKLVLQYRE